MEPETTQAKSSNDAAEAPGEHPKGRKPAAAPLKAAISLTPRAIEMAKAQLTKRGTPNAAIRLGLRGGGCSGFSYVIEFSDDPPRERDRVFEFDGVRVFVDPKSLIYLAGTVLDWEKSLMYQGFKFKNPQEKQGCGCGHSFSV
ncbi:MAG TPA: iron-sulfur cluster assembly accessory protein [Polyangiaceae bacterium]|nr:iron-sulfur cluster assembly accessory protein [Polyangiaceae bacterium]